MGADAPQRLLDPVAPHVGLRDEYIRSEPVTLVMREKLFQLNGVDTAGNDILRVEAKAKSLRDKKVVASLEHMPLYATRRKALRFQHRTIVEDNQENELFTVDEKWSWKSKLQCTVPSANGPVRLSIFGRAFKYQAEIKLDDDTVVATISRECFGTKEGAIKNRQTYYVTVAPGVDLSLMVVLCLAFDDLKRAESRRHSA